jgi:pyruvate formate lyase activating enzyme
MAVRNVALTDANRLGWVFNIQRFSIHDGPGIRTTVFVKGCPLRCQWCHNPEGLERRAQIRLAPALCSHCGRCMAVCEHHGHQVTPDAHILTPDECVACGQCVEVCPGGALELVGKRMSVEEVLAVVRRDVPFYEQSHGGMTISGGEPLAQPDFTADLLRASRMEGIHNVVETSAYGPWERIATLLDLVDLWLVDIKHTDDARHQALTGVSNATILANIRRLASEARAIVLRVPWVPQRNAEPEFLQALIAYVGELNPQPPVELMPYHRLGLGKWESLGRPATMPLDLPAATLDDVQPWVERLREAGIAASVT